MSFLPLHFPPDNKAPQTSGLKKNTRILSQKEEVKKSLLFASNGSESAKHPDGAGKWKFQPTRFHQTGHIGEQICTILSPKPQIVLRDILKST